MKNKKNILILVVILCVIIGVIALFSNSKEKLLVECNRVAKLEKFKMNFDTDVYEDSEDLIVKETITMTFDNKQSEDIIKNLAIYVESKIKGEFDKTLEKDSQYLEYSVQTIDNKIVSEITYFINEKNSSSMASVFGNSLIDLNKDQISRLFEEDGFTCKTY